MPSSGKERIIFQAIMVLFMSSCMVTLNNLIRQAALPSVGFYEYPIIFCIAMLVRVVVANPLVDRIAPHVPRSLSGVKRTLTMTGINVGIMATIMTFFGTFVSRWPQAFTLEECVASIPLSIIMAFTVNVLAIGPLVKIAYTRAVEDGIPFLVSTFSRIGRWMSAAAHAVSLRLKRTQTKDGHLRP